jgi:hypothetical protein
MVCDISGTSIRLTHSHAPLVAGPTWLRDFPSRAIFGRYDIIAFK